MGVVTDALLTIFTENQLPLGTDSGADSAVDHGWRLTKTSKERPEMAEKKNTKRTATEILAAGNLKTEAAQARVAKQVREVPFSDLQTQTFTSL